LNEYQRILQEKDNSIQALNLIIHIIKNYPLQINHYVVPIHDDLICLIQLLTNCLSVEIIQKDYDIGCCCTAPEYVMIDKIFVSKNGETLNLKYSYPDVIKTFDEYRISYKMAIV
jgi:hypothetical protein